MYKYKKVKQMDLSGPICLSALGRECNVGDLYDYYNNRIVQVGIPVPKNFITIEKKPNFSTEQFFMFQRKPLNSKCHVLGIKSHLIDSIESGVLDSDQLWFGGYLKSFQTEREDEVRVDVYFRTVRRTESLDSRMYELNQEKFQETRGDWTHLVEQVVYGAELICSLRKKVDRSCETKKGAEGSLYLAAKTYFDGAIGLNSTSIAPPPELSNVSCVIYNSLDVNNVIEGSFWQSCEYLRDAINQEERPKWKPIEFLLRYIPEQLENRLSSEKSRDLKTELEQKDLMLEWVANESHSLLSHPSLKQNAPYARVLSQFWSQLKPLKIALAKQAQKMTNKEEANNSICNLLDEMTDWLIRRRKEIETMAMLWKGVNSDAQLPMSAFEEIKALTASKRLPRAKVFVLKLNYIQDPLLEKVKVLTNDSQVAAMLPVFSILSAGKETFTSVNKKLKNFAEEAQCHKLGPNVNTSYFIGLGTDSSLMDGSVLAFDYSMDTFTIHSPKRQQSGSSHQHWGIINDPKSAAGPAGFDHQPQQRNDPVDPLQIDEAMSSISSTESMHSEDTESQQPPGSWKKPVTVGQDWSVGMDDAQSDGNAKKLDENWNLAGQCSWTSSKEDQHIQENAIEVDVGLFDKDKRVGENFADEKSGFSRLVTQGQPNVYMLNAKNNSTDADLRWFHIGRYSGVQNHKIIILMGATGCGKSTLINGMVNYILGVQWKDPFRFKCVREDESGDRNQAHSQTSSVTAYTIHHHEGMVVPYSITIIDTPGYGDTRGIARDKEITKTIHRFLTQKKNQVDQIHAACFVAASGDSRLTTTQRYILDSVLSIFGKDVKDNIRLLVTFADNADPPVVEACRAGNFPLTSPSAGIVYSKFNSSVLYASNEQQGEDDFGFDELFWDMGQENFTKFFAMLKGMDGRDLTSTRQVIHCRDVLEQSLKSIESELEECLTNIENIELLRRKLNECGYKMESSKNYVIENVEMRRTKVNCDPGFQAYNCRSCSKTCEARIKNTFKKRPCNDKMCRCPESEHFFQPFEWHHIPAKLKTTLLDMKAEYQSNCKEKMTNEQLVAKCSDDLELAKGKVFSLLDQVGNNARSLESTALRSNSFSPADYLNLIKSRVAEEQKSGYLTRLETLAELQQTWQRQMMTSSASFTPTRSGTSSERFYNSKMLSNSQIPLTRHQQFNSPHVAAYPAPPVGHSNLPIGSPMAWRAGNNELTPQIERQQEEAKQKKGGIFGWFRN